MSDSDSLPIISDVVNKNDEIEYNTTVIIKSFNLKYDLSEIAGKFLYNVTK